jgi:pSer/pThr/pTyr-binding forkhead associated (FHA) protein
MILSFETANGGTKHLKLKTMSSAPPVTMGRSKDATVTLDDNSCSRIHCAIRYWDDDFIVKDMHSRNGTFLNNEKITVSTLSPGDVLKIGATVFRVSAEEGSATDVTMAP